MIEQQVKFEGGLFDGQMAKLGFSKFEIGVLTPVNGEPYEIRDGPLAQAIVKSGKPMEFGMVVMVPSQSISGAG